jgi:hypothetical protein
MGKKHSKEILRRTYYRSKDNIKINIGGRG